MNQREKTKFRLSKVWKKHREQLIKDRSNTCELCQQVKDKGLVVHHKDLNKANYTNLSNPQSFAVLCPSCHKIIHRLQVGTARKKNRTTNPTVYNLIEPFFKA